MINDDFLSREGLLSGRLRHDRRPARLLAAIEARCAYMRRESRRAIQVYIFGEGAEFRRQFQQDYLRELRMQVESTARLSAADLARYACHWRGLVPADPGVRAMLARLAVNEYRFDREELPDLVNALGLDQPDVQAAYSELYGEPWEALFRVPAAGETGELGSGERDARPGRRSKTDAMAAALAEAEAALEWMDLPGGAQLFTAGEPGDALYILISGRLRVAVHRADNGEEAVFEVGRGEMIGLTEMLTGEPRAETVYAVRDSELVRLPQAALDRLIAGQPQVMARLNRILAARLREHLTGLRRQPNSIITFAVLPAGQGAPLARFSSWLAGALETYGQVLHLESTCVDEQLGPGAAQTPEGDAESGRLSSWLSEQEVRYRYVVYQADREPSAWSDRCIRQADRVLLLVDTETEPAIGPLEEAVARLGAEARTDLVLLHAPSTPRPQGTCRWLDPRQVQSFYHVRDGKTSDVQYLARRLTGQALGVVLGGGAARGWAHIGVWRALHEAELEVDLIGGTSMGALVGAMYAMGMTEQEIFEVARRFSSFMQWFDITLPIVSLLKSDRTTEMAREVFGDTQIEDLWRPYFCVASNLTRATPVIFTEGPLWQAVRASTAIPGIFSPVLYEGDVLADGAVLNNLPVDVMQGFGAGGQVVAVNVMPDVDLAGKYNFGLSVSGWEALRDRVNPFSNGEHVPLIFESLIRAISLNDVNQARAKRELVDIYIRPPVERYGILDFRSYRQIAEIGYQTAREEIARWKASGRAPTPKGPVRDLTRALAELDAALEEMAASPRPAATKPGSV